MIAGPARPRVLVADDSPQVLESVAGFLATRFEVVATASDGRQAVDLTLHLQPDVSVLDIGMPELDGFHVVQELRRNGSQARAVFMTIHREDEFVATAVECGVHGYVLKSRLHTDLISAIDHALAGRLFVPSLTALSTVGGTSRHAVQIHLNDRVFLDEVGQFVEATLRSGEPVVLVTNEATRGGVAERLEARGMDLEKLAARGQYVAMDSAEALSQIMRNGRPDRDSLAEMVDGLDRSRLSFSPEPPRRITVFGDITISLCRNGNVEAAIEIEHIWNDLTRTLPIFTVCSYPVQCFQHNAAQTLFPGVCAAHGAVTHTAGRDWAPFPEQAAI